MFPIAKLPNTNMGLGRSIINIYYTNTGLIFVCM